jgi:hypothetical protein
MSFLSGRRGMERGAVFTFFQGIPLSRMFLLQYYTRPRSDRKLEGIFELPEKF